MRVTGVYPGAVYTFNAIREVAVDVCHLAALALDVHADPAGIPVDKTDRSPPCALLRDQSSGVAEIAHLLLSRFIRWVNSWFHEVLLDV